ncbi:hypothetical protein G6F63_015972 [Rhizopus arrhizus]|nr:hypothetical protein G6F63_015972 [Rhizopus arrhizus]
MLPALAPRPPLPGDGTCAISPARIHRRMQSPPTLHGTWQDHRPLPVQHRAGCRYPADDPGHQRQTLRCAGCRPRLRQARGDGADARWHQAVYGDRGAQGCPQCAHPADPHALRCRWPRQPQ